MGLHSKAKSTIDSKMAIVARLILNTCGQLEIGQPRLVERRNGFIQRFLMLSRNMYLLDFIGRFYHAGGARGCETVTVRDLIAYTRDGAPLPAYPAGRPQVTILRATIPPHATLPRHTHAVVNAGVILRGELTVVSDNGTERTFRAGEGIVELVGTVHYGENRGDGETEMVMFYAGTEGVPLSESADL